MTYAARILADSLAPSGVRLTTFEVRFPRFILAEWNTHRMLSRNAASSRAVPVRKLLEQVETEPFVPEYWGANRPGMQATEELSERDAADARATWLQARDAACDHARLRGRKTVGVSLDSDEAEPLSHACLAGAATAHEWV